MRHGRERLGPLGVWLAVLTLLVSCLGVLAGCGKRGDPLPPLRQIPAPARDLSIHQQGNVLIFDLSYPQTTVAGQALTGISAVRILEMVGPITDPENLPEIDERLFASTATQLVRVQGPELTASITGNRIETRLPIAEVPEQPELRVFGVQTISQDEHASPISNLVPLVLREIAEPPRDLALRATPQGLELTWAPPGSDEIQGFNVYRREATVRSFGDPLQAVGPMVNRHLDETAAFDTRYIYTIRAVTSRDPLVETPPSAEIEIDYRDRFAPAPPTGVLALAEPNRVRLVWEASVDLDTVGYYVYRADPGDDFRRLREQPAPELEFLDSGLTSGSSYRYRVTSVDSAGNESDPTPPQSVIVE